MDKLIIGIDLCDAYTQAAVAGRDETWVIPTVICGKKQTAGGTWARNAYKYTLMGEGVIVDQALKPGCKGWDRHHLVGEIPGSRAFKDVYGTGSWP